MRSSDLDFPFFPSFALLAFVLFPPFSLPLSTTAAMWRSGVDINAGDAGDDDDDDWETDANFEVSGRAEGRREGEKGRGVCVCVCVRVCVYLCV